MRITSSQLRQIIKEELLREGMNRLSGPQYMSKFIGLVQYQLKYIREFEIMATECLRIRQQQTIKIQVITQLRKLQSTGTRHNQNKDHDITAKGSNLPAKVSIREQQGGREELLSSPPWE